MHDFIFKNNELYCEKARVSTIAKSVDTPFYLYSHKTICDHFNKIKEAFAEVDPIICFATKANNNLGVLKTLVNVGAGFDIVSVGELKKALKVGADPKKIAFASVGKTEEEIITALKAGILFFNIESLPELEKINNLAKKLKKRAPVALRINPDVDAATHKKITTGTLDNKFGIDLKTTREILKKQKRFSHIDFKGIHMHIGSQIISKAPFVNAMTRVLTFLDILRKDGITLEYLDIGGIASVEREYQKFLDKGPRRMSPHFIPRIIINEAAGQVSIDTGAKGLASCVATACSTATNSIGDAFRFIQYDDADVIISGGTECATSVLGLGGFCALKALSQRNDEPEKASRPFDKDRDGFVMAEGAGITILESLDHAKKRGAPILAEIVGYGRTSDAYHITAPEASGRGASKAMELGLKDAGLMPEDITYINAHGTSTYLNDKTETLAVKNTFGDYAKKVAISSTKSMTGHLLGAAGGVEFAACVMTIQKGIIPPTINQETPDPDCDLDYVPNKAREQKVTAAMSNSLGFGGHNATVVVKEFQE